MNVNSLERHVEKPTRDFSQIPNKLVQGLGNLSDSAYRLYMVLFSMPPNFKPSLGGLGRLIYNKGDPKGEQTIARAVKELRLAGLLEITKTGFNRYRWALYDSPK